MFKQKMEALRKLLSADVNNTFGTQDELCEQLRQAGFEATQSTVSRALRKLGAIKATDETGRTVYRLPGTVANTPPPIPASALSDLVSNIASNGSIVVIHTTPGSASLVARHLDHYRPNGILGTIAGDDTIFVAPAPNHAVSETIEAILNSIRNPSQDH